MTTARQAWDIEISRLKPWLVNDAQGTALVYMAEGVFIEYDAHIRVLRKALDELRGTYSTQFCMDRDLDAVVAASADCTEGDRIRATDTGRELVLRDGAWFEERAWHPATTAGMGDAPVALTPATGTVNRYREREMVMDYQITAKFTLREMNALVTALEERQAKLAGEVSADPYMRSEAEDAKREELGDVSDMLARLKQGR